MVTRRGKRAKRRPINRRKQIVKEWDVILMEPTRIKRFLNVLFSFFCWNITVAPVAVNLRNYLRF